MMTCQDDAAKTGPVALFCGIETATWTDQQFHMLAAFCQVHAIRTLFVKMAEVGSSAGDVWYGGYGGVARVIALLEADGIYAIPYMFPCSPGIAPGAVMDTIVSIVHTMLSTYPAFCLDIEGGQWVGSAGSLAATQIAATALPLPGKVYLSHPANFADADQRATMVALSPVVSVWMPMAYSDYLVTTALPQVKAINPQACIQPTLDLSQEFGPNDVAGASWLYGASGVTALSFWYEGFAQDNPALFAACCHSFLSGSQSMISGLSATGEVATFATPSQMEAGESEFACGFFAVAGAYFSGPPQGVPRGTPEQVDQWADAHGALTTSGVSIDDMHMLLQAAGLHYWDIESISETSDHVHDNAEIAAAVRHGYMVVVTVPENSVYDLDLHGNPYAPNWTPSGNHVLLVTGIAPSGDWLCRDTAAITGGIFGAIAPQPRRYRADMVVSWASVIQSGWLPSIPSGDPLGWKELTMGVPIGWKDDGVTLTAPNGLRVVLGFRAHILGKAWDAQNVPMENEHGVAVLEESNPSLGGGTQQIFRGVNGPAMLGYSPARGVMEEYAGQELFVTRQHEAALVAQVATLQAQLTAAQGGLSDAVKQDIAALLTAIQIVSTDVARLAQDSSGGHV